MNYVLMSLSFLAGALCVYFVLSRFVKTARIKNRDDEPFQLSEPANIEHKQEVYTGSEIAVNEQQDSPHVLQLQKTLDDLYIVNELGQYITSSLNLLESFRHLHTTLNSMMDAAILELQVFNKETESWKVFSTLTETTSMPVNHYNILARWSFNNKREVFLADAEHDYERFVYTPQVLPDGRLVKSALVFPVKQDEQVTGTLSIFSLQQHAFEEYHRKIIRLLLGYISVAIQNALTHEELSITKQRAERSEKFMQQFLANMSHEIRTPINAVTGMSRLLLEKSPRQDQLSYLEGIQNASDALLVIINDILDLSKIEAGKIELEKIEFSLPELLQHVRAIMLFKAEEKGLTLMVDLDPVLPPVLIGDPTRLSQILINLLGNAVKFTEKGQVRLWVSNTLINDMHDTVSDSTLNNRVKIRFEISDTGIGMTPQQQQLLFQDYVQASADTTRKYGGTGLGLSISQQLVKLQGGQINVRSIPGQGSVFAFELVYPVSKNKAISKKEQMVSEDMITELKGLKVLLADDNEYNRIIARETLQSRIGDIQIDEAQDGAMAVDLIKKNNYHVVLMDLVMPKMDGYEATLLIRTKLPSPKNQIPIIALTASVVKSEIDRSRAAGMNGFIPKPFKSFELIAAIYYALHRQTQPAVVEPAKKLETLPANGQRIQRAYLEEYAEGDQVRIQRFIELFLTKTPGGIQKLRDALQDQDYPTLRITAHSLKPPFRSVGLLEGIEMLDRIESDATEKKNMNQIPACIDQLAALFEEAAGELKEM